MEDAMNMSLDDYIAKSNITSLNEVASSSVRSNQTYSSSRFDEDEDDDEDDKKDLLWRGPSSQKNFLELSKDVDVVEDAANYPNAANTPLDDDTEDVVALPEGFDLRDKLSNNLPPLKSAQWRIMYPNVNPRRVPGMPQLVPQSLKIPTTRPNNNKNSRWGGNNNNNNNRHWGNNYNNRNRGGYNNFTRGPNNNYNSNNYNKNLNTGNPNNRGGNWNANNNAHNNNNNNWNAGNNMTNNRNNQDNNNNYSNWNNNSNTKGLNGFNRINCHNNNNNAESPSDSSMNAALQAVLAKFNNRNANQDSGDMEITFEPSTSNANKFGTCSRPPVPTTFTNQASKLLNLCSQPEPNDEIMAPSLPHFNGQENEKRLIGSNKKLTELELQLMAAKLLNYLSTGNNNTTQENPTIHKPIYDMKIQTKIRELQKKKLVYTSNGGVVSSDGEGIQCTIEPATSGVSMNFRFG